MTGPDDLVPVFRTADISLLAVVKSLLDSAGIDYFVQGEEALGLFPVGPLGGSLVGKAIAAVVMVPAERAEEAEALLEEVAQPDPQDEDAD